MKINTILKISKIFPGRRNVTGEKLFIQPHFEAFHHVLDTCGERGRGVRADGKHLLIMGVIFEEQLFRKLAVAREEHTVVIVRDDISERVVREPENRRVPADDITEAFEAARPVCNAVFREHITSAADETGCYLTRHKQGFELAAEFEISRLRLELLYSLCGSCHINARAAQLPDYLFERIIDPERRFFVY